MRASERRNRLSSVRCRGPTASLYSAFVPERRMPKPHMRGGFVSSRGTMRKSVPRAPPEFVYHIELGMPCGWQERLARGAPLSRMVADTRRENTDSCEKYRRRYSPPGGGGWRRAKPTASAVFSRQPAGCGEYIRCACKMRIRRNSIAAS